MALQGFQPRKVKRLPGHRYSSSAPIHKADLFILVYIQQDATLHSLFYP